MSFKTMSEKTTATANAAAHKQDNKPKADEKSASTNEKAKTTQEHPTQ